MTRRAKRLAEYLMDPLGWVVFDSNTICPGCQSTIYGSPYCPRCGAKQGNPARSDKIVLDELEEAIAFALNEKKPTKLKEQNGNTN